MKLQNFQEAYYNLAKQLRKQVEDSDNDEQYLIRSQQVGRRLFEAMLMKITYIDLRRNQLELFNIREHIYAEIVACTKNSELIREIIHRIFFHLYITQVFGGSRFAEEIEKQFIQLAEDIIKVKVPVQTPFQIKKHHIEFGRPAQPIQVPAQNIQLDRVELYLTSQVQHPKTELTEFCHQMKIPEPFYSKVSEGKIFKILCKITIPAELRDEFNEAEFSQQAFNLSGRLATVEAARKLLKRMYTENSTIFEKFKDIKRRKKIIT